MLDHRWPCRSKFLDISFFYQASRQSVLQQITDGKKQVAKSKSEAFALIIDGKSLAYALDDGIKNLFLDLAVGCASVICCRSSPKQKALVSLCLYLLVPSVSIPNHT